MATRRTLLGVASLAAAGGTPPLPARAADWQPDRSITMIVAYAAGGGTDTAARTLARFMERDLGQPVVITNRPGAGGEIGFSELVRAKPDGYTIGFTNTPTVVTIPIERQARFRFEDFTFIANIVDDPGGMWVLADSPIASLPVLVEEARRRPGELSYGTTGVGSDDHLAMLAFERLTGTRFLHVPFGGSSQVRTALLGRQLALAVVNMAEGIADWRQGLIRPLGAMATARWEGAPDVPTFREQGFDVVEGSMRGVGAPRRRAPPRARPAGALDLPRPGPPRVQGRRRPATPAASLPRPRRVPGGTPRAQGWVRAPLAGAPLAGVRR